MAQLGFFVAEKLIEVLGREAIMKVCEVWGYKSELEELKQTVFIVRMVLLDADAKWDHLSNQDKDFISKLRDVVYDADDVFDEFLTLAELNMLDGRLKKRDRIFKKVCRFFSSKNQVSEAYRISCEVKDIKKRLDDIANVREKFNLSVDNRPICRRPKETCSYVDVNDIIGRDNDKKKIVNMLLDPNASDKVYVLPIVGVGGLGKTTLAQLVFSDEKIKQEFPNPAFRLWVCVSDQDGEQFDDTLILSKILELVTNTKPNENSSKERLQREFHEKIRGNKFLLVLDDVWNENRKKWLDLEVFLRVGQGGSKIIVTTRSETTAAIVKTEQVYKLDGLSPIYSQCLFEKSAFHEGQKSVNHNELLEIGKKIVEKCHCIPLALKVVGSLLYGQDIKKWQLIQESGLAKLGDGGNGILSILKLSYHNLEPSLKSCFSYCAVFPKDFEIEKEKIIRLWLAQGYIVPLDGGQNIEDAAEEHFIILLRRCFFQVVERDEYDDVKSIKIHDLMHDVAQEVGKEEICILKSLTDNTGDKIRHVYIKNRDVKKLLSGLGTEGGYKSLLCTSSLENSIYNKKIRSYFNHGGCFVDAQINNWVRLRVLVLSMCQVSSLPYSIQKLMHLRYLDLSKNINIKVLCESITELYNLETLDLSSCHRLTELSKGISKLVNLRYLNLNDCRSLTSMPSNMNKLTNLRVLPMFVVGHKSIINEKLSGEGKLEDLKALNKVQGSICVKIGNYYRSVEDVRGGYLKSMEDLSELEIEFESEGDFETILEKLEPPPNLKKFVLNWYRGKIIRWGRAEDNWAISLPLLVNIEISCGWKLEQMPMLSTLPNLKSLTLYQLTSMKYMEIGLRSSNAALEATQFFPSLESLEILSLPKLKGWMKQEGLSLIFPCLTYLKISCCPNLVSNLICPRLRTLELEGNSEGLHITYGTLQNDVVKARTLMINRLGHVKSVSIDCMAKLGKQNENNVERLLEKVELAFHISKSPLHTLCITGKPSEECSICEEEEDDEEEEKLWKSFHHSLCVLKFNSLPGLKCLPKGMQHLTSLQSLCIQFCDNIKELPEWMGCLSSLKFLYIGNCPGIKELPEAFKKFTSLKTFEIYACPDLAERCIKPNGEDLPKIQYISQFYIDNKRINNDDVRVELPSKR